MPLRKKHAIWFGGGAAVVGACLLFLVAYEPTGDSIHPERTEDVGRPGLRASSGDAANMRQPTGREKPVRGPVGTTFEERRKTREHPLAWYKEQWEALRGRPAGDPEFRMEAHGLVTSMAFDGFAREALAEVHATVGPGEARCGLVGLIFSLSAEPASSGGLFAELEHPDERAAAAEGLARALALQSRPEDVAVEDFEYLGDERDGMLGALAVEAVHQGQRRAPDKVESIFEESFRLPLSPQAERKALLELSHSVPFLCWRHLAEKGLEKLQGDAGALVDKMVREDPARAAAEVAAAPGGERQLAEVFSQWMAKDALGPVRWLEQATSLSPRQRDRARQGIARYAAGVGELETARQWIGNIADPGIREAAMAEMDPAAGGR